MDCVVAPIDQVFPAGLEEVKITEPPVQNVVEPFTIIVGLGGAGIVVNVIEYIAAVPQAILAQIVVVPVMVNV